MKKSLPLFLVMFFIASAIAMEVVPADKPSSRYIAHIQLHTSDELEKVLERADALLLGGQLHTGQHEPIVFVLHGPEADVFVQGNYIKNKKLVDLAARLTAFQVVDIRVCETWMGGEGVEKSQLPPFVTTVPFGPAETKRLMEEERYVYF